VIDVVAGDAVQATWRHTLTSGSDDVIDPSHKVRAPSHLFYCSKEKLKPPTQGPVIAYMKKVADATTDVGYGAGWFNIMEAGLNAASEVNLLEF
jgi:Auxiliary Activity family 9 (formerly GH61)